MQSLKQAMCFLATEHVDQWSIKSLLAYIPMMHFAETVELCVLRFSEMSRNDLKSE